MFKIIIKKKYFKKWIILLFLLYYYSFLIYGQQTITCRDNKILNKSHFQINGKIKDSISLKIIPYLSINIFFENDSFNVVHNIISNERGEFHFTVVGECKSVLFKISSILCDESYKKIDLTSFYTNKVDTIINIGTILIPIKKEKTLKEVAVVGTLKNQYTDIQKRTYLVNPLIGSAPTIIISFLKTLPGITIKGEEILVDGRKKPIFYLNDVICSETIIKNLPLDIIKKVEIITNPPMSKDFGPNGCIINVVTKKMVNYTHGGQSSISNGIIRNNISGLFSSYITKNDFFLNLTLNGYTNRYKIKQESKWKNQELNNQIYSDKGNTKYFLLPLFNSIFIQNSLNKMFTISGDVEWNEMNLDYNSNWTSNQFYDRTSNQIIKKSKYNIDQKCPTKFGYLELKTKINDKSTFYFISSLSVEKNYNNIHNFLIDSLNDTYNGISTKNNTINRNLSVQASNEYTFKETSIENGILYYNNNSSASISINNDSLHLMPEDLNYKQKSISFFSTVIVPLSFVNIKIGLKEEGTNYETHAFGDSLYKNNTFKWIFIPNLTIFKYSERTGTWIISFRRETTLPSVNSLNPSTINYKPNVYNSGHPNLNPEISNFLEFYHLIDFGKKKNNTFNTNLYAMLTKNLIGLNGLVINKNDYTLQSNYDNLGTYFKGGCNLSLNSKFNNNFSLNVNSNIEYYQYKVNDYNKINDGWATNFNVNFDCNIIKTISTNVDLNYGNLTYDIYSRTYSYRPSFSLGFDKHFCKNKLFLSIDWNSIFIEKNVKKYNSRSIQGRTTNINKLQEIQFTLTYIFGNPSSVDKKSENKTIEQHNIKKNTLF
jgi:hypothetical protein